LPQKSLIVLAYLEHVIDLLLHTGDLHTILSCISTQRQAMLVHQQRACLKGFLCLTTLQWLPIQSSILHLEIEEGCLPTEESDLNTAVSAHALPPSLSGVAFGLPVFYNYPSSEALLSSFRGLICWFFHGVHIDDQRGGK
jgi:hypothetical protein